MESKFMLAHRGDLSVLIRDDMAGEDKFDGTRNHAIKTPISLNMWSRDSSDNQYKVDYAEKHNLPEVEHDLRNLNCHSCWLDMELVWFNSMGRSIMRGSQVRCGTTNPSGVREKMRQYFINGMCFDLLELDGEDLTQMPYAYRKMVLQQFMEQQKDLKSLRYVPYHDDKKDLWNKEILMGGEGIMAKTIKGTYEFRRSKTWLKLKNEGVTDGKQGRPPPMKVVGYTPGQNARASTFGSLVLMNEDQTYGGNVGGGFTVEELEWWSHLLDRCTPTDKPFDEKQVGNSYTAVNCPYRVKVRYYEKTVNGALRFPVYVGIEK